VTHWPTEIRLSTDKRTLTVVFDNGEHIALPAEFARVESPSAEVQGHSPQEKIVVTGKQDVAIAGIEPVGNYAVRLIFDDGHASGLYTWDYLAELGHGLATSWPAYLASQGRG
jgi:DUF971 family protein